MLPEVFLPAALFVPVSRAMRVDNCLFSEGAAHAFYMIRHRRRHEPQFVILKHIDNCGYASYNKHIDVYGYEVTALGDRHEETARVFKALCDLNRLMILKLLRHGEMCACQLLEELNIGQPTLSHHMKSLCGSGVVHCRRKGKWMLLPQQKGL